MENASKALLIAGGVLIAMIITSFGVYLYGVYRGHSENMIAKMTEKEVTEFNAKFTVFEDRELTANEVVSIMNLCRENNSTRMEEEYKIDINWGNVSGARYDSSGAMHEFDNLDSIAKDDFQKKCINFINTYSEIAKIKKTDSSGTTVEETGYVYGFFLKIINYNSTTGLVNKLLVQGKKYEKVI